MEYLLWWVKKGPEPQPLVTTSSLASLGILGAADTVVVTGGSAIDYQAFSGMRMSGGIFFNDDHAFGIELGGFFTEHRPYGTLDSSSPLGQPLLARPIINAQTGLEAAELVSAPGIAMGSILIGSTSSLSGYDINAITGLWRDGPSRLTLLAGFRYVTLTEDITIMQSTDLLPGGSAGFNNQIIGVPTNVGIFDKFAVDNNFYGGQIGAMWEYNSNSFFINSLVKLAIGGVHEDINIGGFSSSSGGGTTPTSTSGGLLALASNSGHANHDDFAFVPELGVNVGYQFTPVFRAYVGYTFLWISDVARPGDLINRDINPSLVPTSTTFGTNNVPAEPNRSVHQTDFWAQGFNIGVEFRY
jgi:Putative beta barrel porin-7 (BBP7)